MGLLMGGFVAQAVGVFAELGVADHLGDTPASIETLAAGTNTNQDNLYRLLRALSDLGVVSEVADRRFTLTPVGALLRTDNDRSLVGLARLFASEYHRTSWTRMADAVRTGLPAFDLAYGQGQFDYLRAHPAEAALFDDAMTSLSRSVYGTLDLYDFSRFARIADIGGGNGAFLAQILEANPSATGILFDLPDVAERGRALMEDRGLAERCEAVGGNFFQGGIPEADLYILTAVVHDWDDDQCLRILSHIVESMPREGVVLVSEPVLPDGPEPSLGKVLDLENMVGTTGRQRTEAEFRALFARSPLEIRQILRGEGPDALIESTLRGSDD
ncbi:methyltransferase [Enemella evansiae]|nr:methyltransferase [Enemella evansiae]